MKRNIIKKIFIVKIRYILLISIVAFPLVIYSLNYLDSMNIISLFSYLLSAYSLIIICISIPRIKQLYKYYIKEQNLFIIKFTKNIMYKNKYTKKYFDEKEYRALISLYFSFLINLCYAIYRCIAGYTLKSTWFFAIGIYYLIFSIIRLILIKNINTHKKITNNSILFEYKIYRLCGVLILILNIAMLGMIVQMILKNETYIYDYHIIYITALYTFYTMGTAIWNVIYFSKRNNIIFSAAKNINLVGALMSLFILQTAMINVFGDNTVSSQLMNTITGSVISILTIIIGLFMIILGSNKIKKCRK